MYTYKYCHSIVCTIKNGGGGGGFKTSLHHIFVLNCSRQFMSSFLSGQHSLAWSIALRTYALYTLPRVRRHRTRQVNIGSSSLNFPHTLLEWAAVLAALHHLHI